MSEPKPILRSDSEADRELRRLLEAGRSELPSAEQISLLAGRLAVFLGPATLPPPPSDGAGSFGNDGGGVAGSVGASTKAATTAVANKVATASGPTVAGSLGAKAAIKTALTTATLQGVTGGRGTAC